MRLSRFHMINKCPAGQRSKEESVRNQACKMFLVILLLCIQYKLKYNTEQKKWKFVNKLQII